MNGLDPVAVRESAKMLSEERYRAAKRAALDSFLTLYTMRTGWELHYDEGCGDMRSHPDSKAVATDEQREALAFCLNCHNTRQRRRGLK